MDNFETSSADYHNFDKEREGAEAPRELLGLDLGQPRFPSFDLATHAKVFFPHIGDLRAELLIVKSNEVLANLCRRLGFRHG